MSETDMQTFAVDPDEPAVHNAALLPFVEAARQQSARRLYLDAATVSKAWAQRRASKRRVLAVAVAAGLGALALGGLYGNRANEPSPTPSTTSSPAVAATDPTPSVQSPAPVPTPEATPEVAPPPVQLADAIRLTAAGDGPAPQYRIDGPYEVTVHAGATVVSVDDAAQPLVVHTPDADFEIHTGVTHVVVAGDVARVEVIEGTTFRITRDGGREQLGTVTAQVQPPKAKSPATDEGVTADMLADRAEQRLTAGDRNGAIKHLRQLVRKFPSSGAARTGLLDLARLLKADGHKAEARCAYQEFLNRHPRSSVVGEVERALDKLGEGQCRGLKPR